MRVWLTVLAFLVVLVPAARADGDPASDVLYLQDVYLPYKQPSASAAADLQAAVADANKAGYKTKVAVIESFEDLGLVSSLFGKPQAYAGFLDAEIRSFFPGHLLVVMPQGFGLAFNRFDVRSQLKLLTGVKIESVDPDGLSAAAAAAVRLLQAKDTSSPRLKDTTPPAVKTFAAQAKRGSKARLDFTVRDASGRSREEIRIYDAKLGLLDLIKVPVGPATGRPRHIDWRTLSFLKPQRLMFCVVAVDPSGNQSQASCAALSVT